VNLPKRFIFSIASLLYALKPQLTSWNFWPVAQEIIFATLWLPHFLIQGIPSGVTFLSKNLLPVTRSASFFKMGESSLGISLQSNWLSASMVTRISACRFSAFSMPSWKVFPSPWFFLCLRSIDPFSTAIVPVLSDETSSIKRMSCWSTLFIFGILLITSARVYSSLYAGMSITSFM